VLRIKSNQTGVENKQFKYEQFIEAFLDPKTWLFALLAALSQVPNSLNNQRQIIVSEFGFNTIDTTLLGCVDGVMEILAIYTAVQCTSFFRNSRAYVGALWMVPGVVGGIVVIALPLHNKVGLLFGYWVSIWWIASLPILLGWLGTLTAGHTKRITTNAIVLFFYAIGNASGPFMWKEQYRPRDKVPWAVIIACDAACGVLFLVIRAYLVRQNRLREALLTEQTSRAHNESEKDDGDVKFVLATDVDGVEVHKKVDKEFLDLTDGQNLEFRYVL